MAFYLFLLVNAVLFLRPAEVVPELERLPLFQVTILACMAASIVDLIRLVTADPKFRHPTVFLLFAMFGFCVVSMLVNLPMSTAFDEATELTKSLVYFTLFLALVRTPGRLQALAALVVACTVITSILSILHYYEVITIPILDFAGESGFDPVTGESFTYRRLRFTGILNDPNEVAVLLGVLLFLCFYQLQSVKYGISRFLWLLPMGLFLFTSSLTVSRGGFMALLTGVVVYGVYRFNGKKVLPYMALVLPLLFLGFAGRQTSISLSSGTGNSRIGLWSDWMDEFRAHPVIGISPKVISEVVDTKAPGATVKHCAHNSYLQAFADIGFFGGLTFLGAVIFAFYTLHQYGFQKTTILDSELERFHPCLVAALAVYMMGMMSLMLNYVIPTFFMLALPIAFYGMTPCYPPVLRPRLSAETLIKLAIGGVVYLAMTYAAIRLFRNY